VPNDWQGEHFVSFGAAVVSRWYRFAW